MIYLYQNSWRKRPLVLFLIQRPLALVFKNRKYNWIGGRLRWRKHPLVPFFDTASACASFQEQEIQVTRQAPPHHNSPEHVDALIWWCIDSYIVIRYQERYRLWL